MSGRNGRKTMKFESLYGEGENPKGMTSQTVNGTGHATGTGWNAPGPFDDYEQPQVEPSAVWPAGRSNRTAE